MTILFIECKYSSDLILTMAVYLNFPVVLDFLF